MYKLYSIQLLERCTYFLILINIQACEAYLKLIMFFTYYCI